MADKELQELKEYWINKYPNVSITFYPRMEEGKYCGKMMTNNQSLDLQADTVGELISQGESFLRKVVL